MGKISRILLVDDDETTNMLNLRLLSKMGIAEHVDTASDGMEAMGYLMSKQEGVEGGFPQPDLIFLDVRMPVMDGFEFLAAYSKLDKNQKAKAVVVMLSTSMRQEDIDRANQYQVDEYLNKPLTEEKVYEILEKFFS